MLETNRKPGMTSRRCMAAMVLGTAMALTPAAPAAQAVAEQTIQDLGRYCTVCWRNARVPADRWGDCTQEVFQRLLERVPQHAWGEALRQEGQERVEFLRAIDTVKKRVSRLRRFSGSIEGLADLRDSRELDQAEERSAIDQAAGRVLSERQQHVIRRSLEGWSVADIADELRAPAARISDEKYKAIQRLRAELSQSA